MFALAACGPGVTAPAAPAVGNAQDIYDEMLQRYARAKSYADHGEATIEAVTAGGIERDQLTFATHYVRGDRFRFDLAVERDPQKAIELWSDKTHTYLKAFFNDTIIDYGTNLVAALRAPAGITAGLTTELPLALLDRHARPTAVRVVPSNGPLWHLVATFEGHDIELYIDRKSLLVTRTERELHSVQTTSRPVATVIKVTVTYEGAVDGNVVIAAPELTLPVVPDGPPAWLGILTDSTTSRVQQVIPGAPADTAGVKVGDEVVSIDGHVVATGKDVVDNAHKLRPEQKAAVVVKRNGTSVPLTVVAKARPDAQAMQAKFVGSPAPLLAVPGLDGKPIDLATLRGSVVVVDFWATWCKPCAVTTPHLDKLAKRYPALRVVGISDEPRDDVTGYLAKHPVSYAQALDASDQATRDYLIQGLPTVYVIDKAGIVRFTAVGVPDFDDLDAAVVKALN